MAVSGFHSQTAASGLNASGSSKLETYYIKGSIDAIIDRCKFYYVSDESTPMLEAHTRSTILSRAHSTAARGLRVIALAYGYGSVESSRPSSHAPSASNSRSTTPNPPLDKEKCNLVFVGFQAMLDPPRKGVADAIGLLQSGGVQVVMITGDAEQTALSIARELGLRIGSAESACLTGAAIDRLSKAQLRERVGAVSVFARTTPKHKMAIVEAFQARGAVVAMTGDGGAFFLFFTIQTEGLKSRDYSERCSCVENGGYRSVDGQERDRRSQRSGRRDLRRLQFLYYSTRC